MTFVSGVELTLLFQAVLLGTVVTAISVVGWLLAPPDWGDTPGAATRWVDEVSPLVCEVQQTLDAGENVPHDRLQRRLLPLSSRLDRYAGIAPATVDDCLVGGVTELGYGCRTLGMELTHTERVDWGAPGSEVEAVRDVADDLLTELEERAEDDATGE
jgi:hypothetical protein